MKRLLSITLVFVMLLALAGCGDSAPEPQPTETPTQPATDAPTQPVTEAPTEEITETPTEEPTEAPTTEPPQVQQEKVTVYLLESIMSFDNGHTEYEYDEDHNINSYVCYSLENDVLYTMFYEQKDTNGMPGQYGALWSDGTAGESYMLSHRPDGKLVERLYEGGNFTGTQYEYDENGNMSQKRDYYEGILDMMTVYEYDSNTLVAAHCEDMDGNVTYTFRVENGLIVEKNDANSDYGICYEYDENNNLVKTTVSLEGDTIPGDQFTYTAVEVDAAQAVYLIEQQSFLLSSYY